MANYVKGPKTPGHSITFKCSVEDCKHIPDKAKQVYIAQLYGAKRRGIGWGFALLSWWNAWQQSGKWDQRGPGMGYCMGRHGDVGPYSPDNVYICTGAQNSSDWRNRNPALGARKRYGLDGN